MTKGNRLLYSRRSFAHSASSLSVNARHSKQVKDAPTFKHGKPAGKVAYPPFDNYDGAVIAQQHEQLKMQISIPLSDYPRTIPYNCGKGGPLAEIGVEKFEVFNYSYAHPNQNKRHTVLWDYTKGLVRTTPFFKSCGYSKTTPAKVLDVNQGLRDLCYSVTGGALVAQGYWMPYEAAKAVAATFAYEIRYALTPIFGPDFLDICLKPTDRKFGSFIIDKDIIQYCANRTQQWKLATLRPSRVLPAPFERTSAGVPIKVGGTFESTVAERYNSPVHTEKGIYDVVTNTSLISPPYTPPDAIDMDISSTDNDTMDDEPSTSPFTVVLRSCPIPRAMYSSEGEPGKSAMKVAETCTRTHPNQRLLLEPHPMNESLNRSSSADIEAAQTLIQISKGSVLQWRQMNGTKKSADCSS